MIRLLTWSAVLVLGVIGCSRPSPPRAERPEAVSALPLGLIIEREISGRIGELILRDPAGVAVDNRGTIYVADRGNNRILALDSNGNLQQSLGGLGGVSGQFTQPGFIAVDNNLNLVVADEGNRRITRHDARLNFVSDIPLATTDDTFEFGTPAGVALTDYGDTWVVDRSRNRIAVFSAAGTFDRYAGDFGDVGGSLVMPEDISLLPDNVMLVCDRGNRRLIAYDDLGGVDWQTSLQSWPDLQAAAPSSNHNRVWILSRTTGELGLVDRRRGVVYTTGPVLTGSPTALRQPFDIAMDRTGRLLIADSGNDRLLLLRVLYPGE